MEYRIIRSDDYLAHHGVLGMKWGVRRYQNYDGSLTPEGKALSPNKLRKKMQKQVNQTRGKIHGNGNRWLSDYGIGEHSNKVQDEIKTSYKKWTDSDEYKIAKKKTKQLDSKQLISDDDYEKKYSEIWEKANKTGPPINAYTIINSGRKYVGDYVNTTGKKLTVAYLKDLGYNESAANYIQKTIQKSKQHVLD